MATDNFQFRLVGTPDVPFEGYLSAEDPTKASPRMLVRGSQNTVLFNNGNIGNRPGIKRYDPADNTPDPVVASFDWNDVNGNTLLTRVLESGVFQFYRTENETWYTVYDFGDSTDLSFAKWWSQSDQKESLIVANGTSDLYAWGGGFTDSVGPVVTNNTINVVPSSFVNSISYGAVLPVPSGIETATSFPTTGAEGQAVIVLETNPTENSVLEVSIDSVVGAYTTTSYINFRNPLIAPVDPAIGQVLIGATVADTTANLLAFLQNPGANTATQVGFTDPDVIDAYGIFTYGLIPSLESADTSTWQEQGFVSNSSITVSGVEYTYGLIAGRFLTDISGTPATGQFAYNGLVVTDMTPQVGDFLIDFLLCLRNQIIGCSYTNRVVYISSNQDSTNSSGYNDWVQVGDVVLGDPDFAVLDEFPKGGITRGESAYIGAGVSSWYELTPNTTSPELSGAVYTKVTKFSGAGLTAPLGFNFVSTLGEDIIFIDQKNQLRTLGFYRNIDTQKSPSLSLAVRQELEQEDFTGGTLEAIDEFVYIVAPISGKTYIYEIRDDVDEVGNITSKRHWQPFQTWNISRLSIVEGVVHGYSAETPQLYQLWDTGQWVDDTSVVDVFAPYVSRARFAYSQIGERDEYGSFDKLYYEGYILNGSDLTANLYYDYQGSTKITQAQISTVTTSPTLYGRDDVNLIGGSVIGAELIGGGLTDENYPTAMPKFRVIINTKIDACFEYQPEVVSENAGSRWEIAALGSNATKENKSPTSLNISSTVISN